MLPQTRVRPIDEAARRRRWSLKPRNPSQFPWNILCIRCVARDGGGADGHGSHRQ
jgi:hypothetical protein